MTFEDGTKIHVGEKIDSFKPGWGLYACEIEWAGTDKVSDGFIQGDGYDFSTSTLTDQDGNELELPCYREKRRS